MDYKHRNNVLWRWCLFTFAVSLIISLVLTWFKPWGWTVPTGHIWLVPQTTPSWLAWPIVNTLFVLTYVWMKTSYLNLRPFWREYRLTSYLRAIIHGLIVSLFCCFYSLPTLIISSIILSLILYFKLGDEFFNTHVVEQATETYDEEDSVDDWVFEDIPPYGIISMLLFFYTVIVVYQLNHFVPNIPDSLEYFIAFIVMPSIYLAMSICLIIAAIIVVLLALVLLIFSEKIGELLAEMFREIWVTIKFFAEVIGRAFLWIFLGIGFTVVVTAWLIYVACVSISNVFRWLFPPKQATAT